MKYTPVRSYTRICPACATKVSVSSFKELWSENKTPVSIICPTCGGGIMFVSDYGMLRQDVTVRYNPEKDTEAGK